MTDTDLQAITARLANLERELAAARAAQGPGEPGRWRRPRLLGHLSTLSMMMLAFAVGRSATTEAQGGSQSLTVKAPFTVVDAAGTPIIRVTEKGPRGIQTFDLQGKPDSSGAKPVKAPFVVVDDGGRPIFKVERTAGGSQGAFAYNPQGFVAAQMSATGNGTGIVAARDGKAGDGGFGRGAGLFFDAAGNGALQIKGNDDKLLLSVGADGTKIRGATTFVGADDKLIATVSQSGDVRRVQVFNASGGVAANLSGGPQTGFLAVRAGVNVVGPNYDPATAKNLKPEASVLLYINDRGSGAMSIRGANAGRVLEADEKGYYAFGTKAGDLAIAHLGGEEMGRMELANANGDNMVEAGTTKDGRGIVRVGPYIGGPVGFTGLPSVIVGKLRP